MMLHLNVGAQTRTGFVNVGWAAVDSGGCYPQEETSLFRRVTAFGILDGMVKQLPEQCQELLDQQRNVLTRNQFGQAGLSKAEVDNTLRARRWQPLRRGVYATFTGVPDREAELWAAILRIGEDAVLSHWTAAERHQLIRNPSQAIHIMVPAGRNPERWGKLPGVVLHRSDSGLRAKHPVMTPPCTRIEDTVLDLIAAAHTFDAAYTWIARAIGGRLTTAERLRAALDARRRIRWRRDIELALGDAAAGAHSWLERQYLRGVEMPHGLPPATRQARVAGGVRNIYLDNLYEKYGVCVELDGAVAHPAAEQWRDKRRDNHNLVHEGIVTMRLGLLELREQEAQCETAAQVADLLIQHGLPSTIPHACAAPACPLVPRPEGLAHVQAGRNR
jgi:hypothetical protein